MLNFTSCRRLGQMAHAVQVSALLWHGKRERVHPSSSFQVLSTFNTTIALHICLTERQVGRQKPNKVPYNTKKNRGGRSQEGARGVVRGGKGRTPRHTGVSAEKDEMKKYTPVLSARFVDH